MTNYDTYLTSVSWETRKGKKEKKKKGYNNWSLDQSSCDTYNNWLITFEKPDIFIIKWIINWDIVSPWCLFRLEEGGTIKYTTI
jgi:hypothetical protein